mmetsp:Transcript_26240/g.74633  ORF Transcript_26240/g.74633 Transcript_26240/m.74633 type:complete len:216 (+) Transcript_26240:937-1584(+)
MQVLRVVRQHESVVRGHAEERWAYGEGRRVDRRELERVERRTGRHLGPDHLKRPIEEKRRHREPSSADQFLRDGLQVSKGGVQHTSREVVVLCRSQDGCRRAHRPPPQTDGADVLLGTQVVQNHAEIFLLVVPKRDVLALGPSGAGQVQAEHRNVPRQQDWQSVERLQTGRAIAVQVHDARTLGLRRLRREEVAALQLPSAARQLQVSPLVDALA